MLRRAFGPGARRCLCGRIRKSFVGVTAEPVWRLCPRLTEPLARLTEGTAASSNAIWSAANMSEGQRECRGLLHERRGRLVGMVRLRVLTRNDWPLWREVRLAALGEAPQAFKARLADWHSGEERWRTCLEMPGAYNIVALLGGRKGGMASGLPGGSGVCELRSVWVSLQTRGRGVGDLLIAAVDTRSRAAHLAGTVLRLTGSLSP
ncbi:GNAT family N-acetyltransferase [Streptomyces sp. NRRL B-24720]|uniref:GNAT family N-acetyltransferase n=1 Tax=Streptomyces sp. NRRL B-24720 TaxID=1476876 RepID=UPI003B6340C2